MSKHHHHPDEGHASGEPRASSKPLHHRWGFYVAGLFILIALVLFTFGGTLGLYPPAPPPLASATAAPAK